MDALVLHRLHFAFTVTFHYIFPQLTMGLALLLVVLKTMALRTRNEHYNRAARFWARIFGINFAMGVVTGIPMEFQFGTNWARFSSSAGGVIGQTLAMEGVFSFFLESSFLGLFLFGEKRLGPKGHWVAGFLVFLGSWLSGFFIVATDAWMQHPVGYALGPRGEILLSSFWALLLNPWLFWQYLHNMTGAVVTGCFAMAAVGAFYLLVKRQEAYGRTFVRVGVMAGMASTILMLFPTGDQQGKNIAFNQPATLAAMEGLFQSEAGAPLALIGQPDVEKRRLDNPLQVPRALSFLTYQRWHAEVKGLDAFPPDRWPDNIPLVYFSYHIMVGLGTIFIAVMALAAIELWRGRLFAQRKLLWLLMLSAPFPYIANTAGWITAETGRQPWLIYGLMRTPAGVSPHVSAGNALFTLIGFMGMYVVLAMLFLLLVYREIDHGPEAILMETIWFMLVAVMIAMYVVLDGFDLGAGIIQLLVAQTDRERRQVLRSIGPVWDGNEVWLLAGGGTLYFAFPALYATSFSGFYLPLMMVLWLLILRGISIEFRGHIDSVVWKPFWDAVFGGASVLLAIFFGAALGNVVRGVPLDEANEFFLPLWTNFGTGRDVGILDWYTVLVAVAAFATLTVHGALWVALKTEGDLEQRARKVARAGWWGLLPLTVAITWSSFAIQPRLSAGFGARPWGYVFPLLALAGLIGMRALHRGEVAPFLCSSLFIVGMLTSAAFGLYPYVLPSNTDPHLGLTVYNAAAAPYGLKVGLAWFIPGMMLATGYFVYTYRSFAGKVVVDEEAY